MKRTALILAGAATLVLGIVVMSAHAQDRPDPRLQCPNRINQQEVTITPGGPNAYNPNTPDFSPLPAGTTLAAGLNDPNSNRWFRHSFIVRPAGACCQVLSATLVIQLRTTDEAKGGHTTDASNDSWSIRGLNGVGIPGHGGPVHANYTPTLPIGTSRTIAVDLNPAAIAHMNTHGHLSFIVQDDAAVVSATLQINRCCLNTQNTQTPT